MQTAQNELTTGGAAAGVNQAPNAQQTSSAASTSYPDHKIIRRNGAVVA